MRQSKHKYQGTNDVFHKTAWKEILYPLYRIVCLYAINIIQLRVGFIRAWQFFRSPDMNVQKPVKAKNIESHELVSGIYFRLLLF